MAEQVELKPGERVYVASAKIVGLVHIVVHARDDAEFKSKLDEGEWVDEIQDDVNVDGEWDASDDNGKDLSKLANERAR